MRVDGLSKWVLRDCSFTVPTGSVTALVGANGAGKTTLLSVLAGLVPADAGQVEVPRRVAFVAQDKPLYKHFTVAEALRFGASTNLEWDQERARAWLRSFGVPLGERCGRLSGGGRAHVAIAVALGSKPDLLLLDEPLSELDPLARKEAVAQLLASVADHGTTMVLSTHVVSELSGVADHLLLLASGSLVLDGALDVLLEQHVEYTGPAAGEPPVSGEVVHARHGEGQSRFLMRASATAAAPWTARPVSLEELVVGYLEAAE